MIYSPSLLARRRLIAISPVNARMHKTGITYWGNSVSWTIKKREREGNKNQSIGHAFSAEVDWCNQKEIKKVMEQVKNKYTIFLRQNTTVLSQDYFMYLRFQQKARVLSLTWNIPPEVGSSPPLYALLPGPTTPLGPLLVGHGASKCH